MKWNTVTCFLWFFAGSIWAFSGVYHDEMMYAGLSVLNFGVAMLYAKT